MIVICCPIMLCTQMTIAVRILVLFILAVLKLPVAILTLTKIHRAYNSSHVNTNVVGITLLWVSR